MYGAAPAPEGAPTVLLYAHYDVQPAPPEQGWTTDPWVATRRGGRLYGRGASDDKSGIMMHAAALRLAAGDLPVGVKLVIEGEEETVSHLDDYVRGHPDLFAADVVVVADMGDLRAGEPVLTTTLRGDIAFSVTVSTLDHGLHSGEFGGPLPDAMMAMIRLLDSFVDERGDVAVAGLTGDDWLGAPYSVEDLKKDAGLLDGVATIGTGSPASHLWSKPTATVIGIDAPGVEGASNTLAPSVRAKVSFRIAPGSDPAAQQRAVLDHIRAHTPFGARVVAEPLKASPAFRAPSGGRAVTVAKRALGEAFGAACGEVGSGGSIPLLDTLAEAAPGAEFLLFGAEDMAEARIHGADESVGVEELERMIVAEALLLGYLGEPAG